jgi:ferredoxin
VIKYLKTYSDKCIGCGICMSVCSQLFFKVDSPEKSRIRIFDADNGFQIRVCNQCRECVEVCPAEALTVNKQGVVLLNNRRCIGCLACVAVCPLSVMWHNPGELNPFKCIACGECVQQCPVDALEIVMEEN